MRHIRVSLRYLCLACALVSNAALADGLRYEVAPGCPERGRFEEQVAGDCDVRTLDLSVAVQREANAFRLKLLVQGVDGAYAEEKSAQECERLIELVAHVTRMTCRPARPPDAASHPRSSEQGSGTAVRFPPTAAARPVAPGVVHTLPEDDGTPGDDSFAAAARQRVWAAAGLFTQTGTSPGLDGAVALDVGTELGIHSLALGVGGWLPRALDVELEPGNPAQLRISRMSLQLQDCLRQDNLMQALTGRWGLGACFNVGYQVVSSHFPAGTQPPDYRSWPTVGASFSLVRKLSEHLVAEGQLGVDFNLGAAPVTAQPFGIAHEFGTVAGLVGTRLIWVFGPRRVLTAGQSNQDRLEPRKLATLRALTDRNAW